MIYETFIFKNQTYNDIYPADDGSHLQGIGLLFFLSSQELLSGVQVRLEQENGQRTGRHRVTQWKIKI